MTMNWVKLLSPDFRFGKLLVAGKSAVDTAAMIARRPSSESLRMARLIWTVKPRFTMVRNANLLNLHRLAQEVNRAGVAGDFVECGVWNGGSSAMINAGFRDSGRPRASWLFDSFEGLPPPGKNDGPEERKHYFEGMNKGNIDNVRQIFTKLGLPLGEVQFVKGWFQDTLPHAKVEQIALLHIDADWYDSVLLVLNELYDHISPGGYVVFDDYGYWEGCDRAAHDFLNVHGLPLSLLKRVGNMGAYFQKPI